MRTLLLALAALLAADAHAQPADSTAAPPAEAPRVTVRLLGGAAALSLGDAARFHQEAADAYVEAGVSVPTQRAFPAGPSGGVDVLWRAGDDPLTGGRTLVGFGVRYAGSSAYSLYGDYAGTLDLVSRVTAVFLESVSIAEFREGQRVRPFIGSRGGTVFASTTTEEAIDLGSLGASRSTVGGSGAGFALEGFGGVEASAGPVGLFVQGGYRYARVSRLTGEARLDGEVVGEGDLPYGLGLSGWTGVVGLTWRP